jgi:hypothetical protein
MREQTWPLNSERNRQLAARAIATAPPGRECIIRDTRTTKQHKRMLLMCDVIRKAGRLFNGRPLTSIEWYDALCSAFTKVKLDEEIRPEQGLAGELVVLNNRRASEFNKAEFTELMDWVDHWMATQDPPIEMPPNPNEPPPAEYPYGS